VSRSHRILAALIVLTCVAFGLRVALGPANTPRDLSGLERAAAAGQVQNFTNDGTLSVWSSDFHCIEPALQAAAGNGEVRLMTGATQVGTYTRRAGIQARGE